MRRSDDRMKPCFARDIAGNVVLIFALLLVPILISIGAAVDYVRAESSRTQLQAKLDAGLLSAAHGVDSVNLSDPSSRAAAEAQLGSFLHNLVLFDQSPIEGGDSLDISVNLGDSNIDAVARLNVPTAFLNLVNITELNVTARAGVARSGGAIEVALALDTTDSMAAYMPDLRLAAQQLVDVITQNGRNTRAKVALVPYVGAVNVGNGLMQQAWLDQAGTSAHSGQALRGLDIGKYPACTYDPVGWSAGGGSGTDGGWLRFLPFDEIKTAFNELFGIRAAAAAAPYTYWMRDTCFLTNPVVISNWMLLQALPNVTWKGCVEARPEPYDVNDTPAGAAANSRWVPYFWPDGPDSGIVGGNVQAGLNNYIPDGPFIGGTDMEESGWGRGYSVLKYDGRSADIDETAPYTRGPNRACPDPLVPLTNDYGLLSSRISSLNYYADSGTNSAEGVAWAWRTLSPGAPFTEGAPYGEVPKILVLLSDGRNEILKDIGGEWLPDAPYEDGGAFMSHYSSYGVIRHGRFPAPQGSQNSYDAAGIYLTGRMSQACANAKAEGIEIFVVAFGVTDAEANTSLANCASDSDHLFSVSRSDSLVATFKAIATKVSPLRLTH